MGHFPLYSSGGPVGHFPLYSSGGPVGHFPLYSSGGPVGHFPLYSTGGPVGHFTQMVWVDTTRVGYGVAVGDSPTFDGNKIAFVVAKYQEPGNFNWIGQRLKDYSRNVQPLIGKALFRRHL